MQVKSSCNTIPRVGTPDYGYYPRPPPTTAVALLAWGADPQGMLFLTSPHFIACATRPLCYAAACELTLWPRGRRGW